MFDNKCGYKKIKCLWINEMLIDTVYLKTFSSTSNASNMGKFKLLHSAINTSKYPKINRKYILARMSPALSFEVSIVKSAV